MTNEISIDMSELATEEKLHLLKLKARSEIDKLDVFLMEINRSAINPHLLIPIIAKACVELANKENAVDDGSTYFLPPDLRQKLEDIANCDYVCK